MSAIVEQNLPRPRKLAFLWMVPLQAASAFTVWAISSGGETLRVWLLSAFLWLMTLPLLAGIEGALIAMMVFEPLRGLLRRAQYLFVTYSATDPIHVLTPMVTLFAVIVLFKKERLSMLWSTPLAGSVTALALIFFLEIFNPIQGSLFVGLTGALFMLVPIAWFYFGQSVSEKFIHHAMCLVVFLGILGSIYGVYQMTVGYPAFEQYWIDNTDLYVSIAVGHVKRALATFSSAEEWGRYTEVGAIIALGLAFAARRLVARIGWLACVIASVTGVLLSGQRTAIFGFVVGAATLVMLGARNFKLAAARLALMLLPVVLLFVFVTPPSDEEMWSKQDNETVSTLLSHTQRGTMKPAEEESLQIRLQNWSNLITTVIPYRPLGAGLGAGSLSDVRENHDSELPPIDNFILVLALAVGIPGALLFCWVLSRATWLSFKLARNAVPDSRNACINRIVAAIMPALILNSIFGLTFSIYSVAPLAWLLIGWISADTLRARQNHEREIIVL
ncbi:MAG: O-antigen ligase family protein [Acidobacteriota bacterium]